MGNTIKTARDVVREVVGLVNDIAGVVRVAKDLFRRKPVRDPPHTPKEEERTTKSREQLMHEARQSLPGFDPSKYNIAFCGPSRCGKSSLVNVVQGVRDGEPGAAKVGEREMTEKITSYHVYDTHLVVWDLPGCGTERNPFEGYFEDKKLYAFDILFLCYVSGLSEDAARLYRQCVERGIPVAVVRTQADAALQAKVRRHPFPTVEDAQAEMRQEFLGELRTLGLADCKDAFYVSAWNMADNQCNMDEHKFISMMIYYGSQRAEPGWHAQDFVRRFFNFAA